MFEAVDRSTEEGRRQVARIVGRDTSNLSPQEIRAAALETLSGEPERRRDRPDVLVCPAGCRG